MIVFSHLLAATDLSSPSLHAVDRGFLIAAQAGASYTVLHALELDTLAELRELLGGDTAPFAQRIAAETREALTQLLSEASRNRGVSAALRIEPGLAAAAVRRCADEIAADLVLVGAHGKGFLQRFVLGSTASRLLRTTGRPVLVVKEPCRAAYRRVLVAVDFSQASVPAVGLARRIAPAAEVVLCHAIDFPFEGKLQLADASVEAIDRYRLQVRERASRRLREIAQAAGLAAASYRTSVQRGDASFRILSEEDNSDCDLIVIGKHGTNVVEELLLGSVTDHVLSQSRSDVLVVPGKRAPSSMLV